MPRYALTSESPDRLRQVMRMSGPVSSSPNASRVPSLFTDSIQRGAAHIAGPVASRDNELLAECRELYNRDYGVWGPLGPNPGRPVTLSLERLKRLLNHAESSLCVVRIEQQLAGYAIVSRFEIPERGSVHWVTQLVVAKQFRELRVATELLFSAWSFSGAYAWGLATANPYAVRALETTTRRHCKKADVVRRGAEMCRYLQEVATYIPSRLASDSDGKATPIVDTGFFVDHSQLKLMLKNARRGKRRWGLGSSLPEGHEWFAAVFGDQPAVDVEGDRLENLLALGDSVWMEAYARMSLDGEHAWMRHAAAEVEYFMRLCGGPGSVFDAGCGTGRHARELALRGVRVTAIDVVPNMIDRARTEGGADLIDYELVDLRTARGVCAHDAALALYDVLGSSATPGDEELLLAGISSNVRRGGHLLMSVMNAHPLLHGDHPAQSVSDMAELVPALEQLPSSNTMERTGDVFNPDLCLHFRGVFFRKETFTRPGEYLPAELVVRDRRYQVGEVESLLRQAGWDVNWIRPVRAGRWDSERILDASDPAAKELLVFATKR